MPKLKVMRFKTWAMAGRTCCLKRSRREAIPWHPGLEFEKLLSFAFRLFGNMFAGVVLVAVASSLIGFISIVPAMLFLFELFVGVIQAFVFGILTMVFMVMATAGHGHEEEHAPEG